MRFHRGHGFVTWILEYLNEQKPDYRFKLLEMGIEVSGLADFFVVAGSKEKLYPLRSLT
jgi:hypothetical protein